MLSKMWFLTVLVIVIGSATPATLATTPAPTLAPVDVVISPSSVTQKYETNFVIVGKYTKALDDPANAAFRDIVIKVMRQFMKFTIANATSVGYVIGMKPGSIIINVDLLVSWNDPSSPKNADLTTIQADIKKLVDENNNTGTLNSFNYLSYQVKSPVKIKVIDLPSTDPNVDRYMVTIKALICIEKYKPGYNDSSTTEYKTFTKNFRNRISYGLSTGNYTALSLNIIQIGTEIRCILITFNVSFAKTAALSFNKTDLNQAAKIGMAAGNYVLFRSEVAGEPIFIAGPTTPKPLTTGKPPRSAQGISNVAIVIIIVSVGLALLVFTILAVVLVRKRGNMMSSRSTELTHVPKT